MDAQPPRDSEGVSVRAEASAAECVICNHPIAGQVYRLGDRLYCAEHFATVSRTRRAWPAVWFLLLGLVAFALIMLQAGPTLSPLLSGGALVVAGLILSILPALVWLLIFRHLDRLEPERFHHLAGILILGGLISGAVVEPLRRDVFGMHLWSENRWMWAIPITTLTDGLLLALTVYLAVRFSAFPLVEFDERTDGVIYGTAAGLGAAVTYNLGYLLDTGGLRLDVGTARIIIAALVFASIGGLVGYGLGQVRFEPRSVWYLPGIVLLAALLTGVYEWLSSEAMSRSFGYTVWISVLIAAMFGAILFGVINLLVRSTVRETLVAETEADGVAAR